MIKFRMEPRKFVENVLWVLSISVVIHLLHALARTLFVSRSRLPPGPTPWPLIGNLGLLGSKPYLTLYSISIKYGPVMLLRFGSRPGIVVSSYEVFQEMIRNKDLDFANRFGEMVSSKYDILGFGSGVLLFLDYGDKWRKERKIFSHLFSLNQIENFQSSRTVEIQATLRHVFYESKTGRTSRMDEIFFSQTLNVLTAMIVSRRWFGQKLEGDGESRDIEHVLFIKDIFVALGEFEIGEFIPALDKFDFSGKKKYMKRLALKSDYFLQSFIDCVRQRLHKQGPSQVPDLMEMLLLDPGKLTDLDIKRILADVLYGGLITSSQTLEWGLSELLRNPETMKKLQEELDTVVGWDRLVVEADLPKLTYLQAVVQEIFRLHPISAFLLRRNIKASELGGYQVPPECLVFVNMWAMGRSTQRWKRASDFYPERFVGVPNGESDPLAFGSGRRSCPGKILGLRMVQYSIAALIHAANWSLPGGMKPEDLDLSERFGLTLPKDIPLEAIVTPRLPLSVIFNS